MDGGRFAHPVLDAKTLAALEAPVTTPPMAPVAGVSGVLPPEVMRTGDAYTGMGINCWQLNVLGAFA